MKRFLIVWLLLGCAMSTHAEPLGGDFTLTDQHGEAFSLAELRGRVVMLFFGYTSCPHVCPTSMAITAKVLESLGARADQAAVVFVSVDPKRDTPAVLGPYVERFHPEIVALTGAPDALERVEEQYKVNVRFENGGEGDRYMVDHTAHLFLIDRDGQVASIVPYGVPSSQVLTRVEALLDDGD